MILTVPLRDTVLANVVYRWLANGALGAESASGITQAGSFASFRIDCEPPAGAEEIYVYDSTDPTKWNVGGYRVALIADAIADADQMLLANLYTPSIAPVLISPAPTEDESVCRCFGIFKDPGAKSSEGVPVKFTLVKPNPADPQGIFPLSGVPLKSGQFITGRSIEATIVDGELTDVGGNNWQDLIRNDYIEMPGTKYLVESEALGAPIGLQILSEGTLATPMLIELRRRSFDLSRIGDVLLGELTIT